MFAFSSSTHLPSDTPHFLQFFFSVQSVPTLGSPVAPIGAYKQVESYGNSWLQNIEALPSPMAKWFQNTIESIERKHQRYGDDFFSAISMSS